MGSLGNSIQTAVGNLVDDTNIRTTITITPKTEVEGSLGGYGPDSDNELLPVSTYGIPYNYFKSKLNFQDFGDLKDGDTKIIIKGDETIDTNYKITMDSIDFDVIDLKPLLFNDVIVAFVLVLSKRQ